jgi:tRNA A37 threonylcarbamoyladenosine biosynthesis protein TsaE
MTLASRQLIWHSEDDTAAFARQLAALPQLRNAYITLHGDLGAGKTTWCATCCAPWACRAASKPDLCRGGAA